MARKPAHRTRGTGAVRPLPAPGPSRLPLVALALAVAAVYANSLSGAFVLDDQAAIVQNEQIRDLSRPGAVLVPAVDSPVAGRPLASLSLALNYAAGGLDVRGYHVVNIALHLACAFLVFSIVRRTAAFVAVSRGSPAEASLVALAAALLWAVHPLNSEVVTYVSQRTESLMALGYLAAVYAALRSVTDGTAARGRWERLAIGAGVCGALAKESIATLPAAVVLFDRAFLFDAWRKQWRARRRLYGGLAAAWVVVAAASASSGRGVVAGFSSGVSPWTYLLNQAEIITGYLRLAVWPDRLVAFYGWPRELTVGDAAPELLLVSALLLAAAVVYLRRPTIGFPAVWFFVTLAPASSIVPIATEVGAERRMYLPLAGLAVLAALALDWGRRRLLQRMPGWPRAVHAGAIAALTAFVMALGVATVDRNAEYESALTLAQTLVERRPTAVAHHIFAEELVRGTQTEAAIPRLERAIALGNSRARYLLGRVRFAQGRYDEAIEQLEAFVATYRPPKPLVPAWLEPPLPEVVPARFELGRAYGIRGDWDRAETQARIVLDLAPGHIGAQGLLGDVMFARQRWADAITHYRAYLERQPDDVMALLNYGIAQVGVERLDEAVAAFMRAVELDRSNARARELLALAQEDRALLAERGR